MSAPRLGEGVSDDLVFILVNHVTGPSLPKHLYKNVVAFQHGLELAHLSNVLCSRGSEPTYRLCLAAISLRAIRDCQMWG